MARRRKTQFAKLAWRENLPFWALIALFGVLFFTGGSSRGDTLPLVALRPLSVIFCGIGLWTLRGDHIRAYRFLFGMAAAVFALVGLHLIPLPPSLWGALPGRAIITEIDRVAGLGDVWRPISMAPSATWTAFYSLFVPLAVLILGVQLNREQRFQMLPILLIVGMVSGLWGLLQGIGAVDGPFFAYRLSNDGSAVGLFVNRNHQAVFLACLFPMLSVYACAGVRTEEQMRVRGWQAIAAGVVLVPLILVTGSRAGLIAGVLGLAAAAILYRRPHIVQPKKRKVVTFNPAYAIGAFAVICLGGVTVLMSRAQALVRLTAADQAEDLRFAMAGPILDMAWKYFPIGSGIGAFVEVYQIDEPYALLGPNYVNHAHNDWIEVYLTGGLLGLILMAIAVVAFARLAWSYWRQDPGQGRDVPYGRLGVVVIALLGIASIGDYPLRTPMLSAVFMVVALWMAGNRINEPREAKA